MKKDPNNPYEMFSALDDKRSEPLRSFTDELLSMRGEIVEITIGEKAEEIKYDDYTVPYSASIFGRIVDVLDRFVILDCLFLDKNTREIKKGCRIFCNTFQIRMLTRLSEFQDGSLRDILIHSREAEQMRKLLHQMHNKK